MGKSASRWSSRQEGFTLIELLVVVAIVALLAAFAVPRLMSAVNEAKLAPGKADRRVIAEALERYYVDNRLYPNGADVNQIKTAMRGYLKPTTSYRNGYNKGYLYLTSELGQGFVLVDLQRETHDDDPASPGQQIVIQCSDGSTDVDRTFNVVTGQAATLTIPTVSAGPWTVWDSHINNCYLLTSGLDVALMTH